MGSAIPIDEFMKLAAKHVVALEVCAAATGTNGEPPRVLVRIEEALLGPLPPGEREAIFAARSEDSWYAIRAGGDAALARWKATPRASPASGARIIVAVELHDDGALLVWDRSIRADTPVERVRLRTLLVGGA